MKLIFVAAAFLVLGFVFGFYVAQSAPKNACEGGAFCEEWAAEEFKWPNVKRVP